MCCRFDMGRISISLFVFYMSYKTTFFDFLFFRWFVNVLFYLLGSLFIYTLGISIVSLLRDLCLLIHGYIYYCANIVKYKLDTTSLLWFYIIQIFSFQL